MGRLPGGRSPGQGALRIPGPDYGHRFILAQARQLRFQIPETGLQILDTARLVKQQYAGLELDLADAVNVALAAHYRTDAILTLDRRDFRAMRPLTPHKWSGSCRRPLASG